MDLNGLTNSISGGEKKHSDNTGQISSWKKATVRSRKRWHGIINLPRPTANTPVSIWYASWANLNYTCFQSVLPFPHTTTNYVTLDALWMFECSCLYKECQLQDVANLSSRQIQGNNKKNSKILYSDNKSGMKGMPVLVRCRGERLRNIMWGWEVAKTGSRSCGGVEPLGYTVRAYDNFWETHKENLTDLEDMRIMNSNNKISKLFTASKSDTLKKKKGH